jgi:uncharacterized protein (DUF1697 family)
MPQRDILEIIKRNPFSTNENLYVTFLFTAPESTLLRAIPQDFGGGDRWILQDTILYISCPKGYGMTKLSNSLFEKKWNVVATTRNWKTVMALSGI